MDYDGLGSAILAAEIQLMGPGLACGSYILVLYGPLVDETRQVDTKGSWNIYPSLHCHAESDVSIHQGYRPPEDQRLDVVCNGSGSDQDSHFSRPILCHNRRIG